MNCIVKYKENNKEDNNKEKYDNKYCEETCIKKCRLYNKYMKKVIELNKTDYTLICDKIRKERIEKNDRTN